MIEKEEQIFRIWVKRPYEGKDLQTECGKKLRILSPGILNTDSGPDFFDARIELNGQVWVGNIEVHVRASDWNKHGHTDDKAFGNVILHVVAEHDADIHDEHGKVVPVFVLTNDVTVQEVQGYSGSGIQQSPAIAKPGTMQSLESLGVSRMNRRVRELETELLHLKGDMDALFQRHLFRRFGMRANSEPFQQLAHSVPGKMIRRQRNSLDEIEALLYGQSGLLPSIPVDAYSADLLYRYIGLKSKYQLTPMYEQAWKFMRMRPSNFPTIRISQLAVLLNQTENLYTKCMEEPSIDTLKSMFDIYASEYWDDHFRFGIFSGHRRKHLGEEAIQSILINAVALFRYFMGARLKDQQLRDSAVDLLRQLPAENNKLIRNSGRSPANALESQGVLELLKGKGGSKDEPSACGEPHFPYFSKTDYERQQIHQKDCILV